MSSSARLDPSARLVSGAGFVIVAFFGAGLFVMPSSEFLREGMTGPQLAGIYRDHRNFVLAGIYIASVTWGLAFLVFCGALSRMLASAAEQVAPYAWIGLLGGALESAMILVFCLFTNMAAYLAGGAGPTDVLLLHHGALLANNLSGFPTIVCVTAYTVGGRRAGILPSWIVAFAALCILMHALSTASLAPAGVASPSGPASLLAPFTMAAWVLGVSIAIRRNGS